MAKTYGTDGQGLMGSIFGVSKSKATEVKPEAVGVTYKEVGGCDEAIGELERSLQITEEVLRYLVTRVVKPVKARRNAATGEAEEADAELPSVEDEEEEDEGERIGEDESEAAPAAID